MKTLELSLAIKPLQGLLLKARKFSLPVREKTIFSLGGSGYYENPTSDLLAFFLDPEGEHRFGLLFVKTLLDCLGLSHYDLNLAGVSVQREARTKDNKRIDLFIRGLNWTLTIENKIRHHQNNPVTAYQSHAQLYGAKENQQFFAVLSPGEKSDFPPPWQPISYRRYLGALRREIARLLFDAPFSKWYVFAREFILHLENEIYHPTMDKEHFSFVEESLLQIEQLKKLQAEYNKSLLGKLRDALTELFPTHQLDVFDETWALKCHDLQKSWSLALQTPAHPVGNDRHKFRLVFYLGAPTDEQLQKTDTILNDMRRSPEDDWFYWLKPDGYETSAEAFADLERISRVVKTIWQSESQPSQP